MENVFISYSWDDEPHKKWVMDLRDRLYGDGVPIIIDRIDMNLGDSIPVFMEQSISNSGVVLLILTPDYKQKADNRSGGVGYEESIISGETLYGQNKRNIIPVLARGSWASSSPIWVMGRNGVDLTGNPYSEEEYRRLLTALPRHNNKLVHDKELMYSLSGKQMTIILCVHGTEGKSVSELIDLTGMTKSSLYYQLNGLISQGIMIKQNAKFVLANEYTFQ